MEDVLLKETFIKQVTPTAFLVFADYGQSLGRMEVLIDGVLHYTLFAGSVEMKDLPKPLQYDRELYGKLEVVGDEHSQWLVDYKNEYLKLL